MQKRYGALDGLRAIAAVGIVMMHVLENGGYALGGPLFSFVIPEMTNFTFLFMVLSSFSMCCGYYERVSTGCITPAEFYKKRVSRIWPFFALLCALDVLSSPGRAALCEGFVNLTLLHGLLPNPNLSVIGVSWFLGVLFVFYLAFPFFCALLQNKRSAWTAFSAALILHLLCEGYFFDAAHMPQGIEARRNFLYCAVFFMAGGLVYLYRDALEAAAKRFRACFALGTLALVLCLWRWPKNALLWLGISCLLVILALGADEKSPLCCRAARFVSGIGLEIYLCHMLIFRVLEKVGLARLLPGAAGYALTVCLTLAGACCFAVAARFCMDAGAKRIRRILNYD